MNRTFGEECRSYSFTYTFKPFGVPTDARFEERGTFGVYLPEDEFSGEWGEDSQDEGDYNKLSQEGDYNRTIVSLFSRWILLTLDTNQCQPR